jgi:type VI secretion system secreted protein VgrG
MARFSQDNRPFRIDTPLGTDALLLQRFQGYEGMSLPFHYTLQLLSEDDSVDPAAILRKPVVVTVRRPGGDRKIHGLVRRFTQRGRREGLTFYTAEIVPWIWFLTLSRDCGIFQNQSVLEIVQEVFAGSGYADYEIRCSETYPPREYCVQYRESHFNFVSRLLEEEGIFYFFEHTDDRHVLVLADMNDTCQPCPGQRVARMAVGGGAPQDDDLLATLTLDASVHPGKVGLRDYDFTRPTLDLEGWAAGEELEVVYDYPGGFVDLDEGERHAELLLEEVSAEGRLVRGGGTCRAFQSGHTFELEEHYRSDTNQKYLLLHVSHQAEAGDYRTWNTAPFEYRNDFVAMPLTITYRPPRRSAKPRIRGTQTALVVGRSGEEIDTDQHGRVKLQFHWDHVGTKDEKSSCWIRVSHPWAGKGWGAIYLPRIGQEVIVDFLEGDPDRPIVTGRVYNAQQTPPYDLPANKTQSGVKSRSSLDGGPQDFNEIRFEDKKGREEIHIHAQKKLSTVVEGSETRNVHGSRSTTIGDGDKTVVKDGDCQLVVKQGDHVTQVELGSDTTEALTSIELKVGSNSITIDQGGITIKGIVVTIEGTGMLKATSPLTTVEGKGMLTLTADGMAQLTGAIVVIN